MRITRGDLSIRHVLPESRDSGMDRQKSAEGIIGLSIRLKA